MAAVLFPSQLIIKTLKAQYTIVVSSFIYINTRKLTVFLFLYSHSMVHLHMKIFRFVFTLVISERIGLMFTKVQTLNLTNLQSARMGTIF